MIALRHYRNLLARRWALPCMTALCVGLGVLIGAFTTQPVYEATAVVEVDVPTANPSAAIIVPGLAYTQARLATTTSILGTVAARYPGLNEAELRAKVTAIAVANSALILITVRDSVPSRASSLATDIATELVSQQDTTVMQTNRAAQQPVQNDIDVTSAAIQAATVDLARLQASNSPPSQIVAKRAELDTLNARYAQLQLSLSAILLDQADKTQLMHVAAPADPNPPQARTVSLTILALGGLFGFMLGIVALVLYDQWRGQVDTAGQLERLLNLPVLSTVSAPPTSPDATPGSVTAIRADNAYHDLEIALSYLRIERPLRTVALTSVGTEDAKQAVAEEMALAAARLGKKALLVQADLTAATGGASASDGLPGLSEAIADYQSPLTPADAINAYIQAPGGAMPRSLRLLPAGTAPPHPARLLATPAADRAFMGIIASDAEAIIIVAPPLLDYEGAKGVCTHADGALLVITLGVVRWQDVLEARRRLLDDGAHLLGCVAVQGSPA